MIVSILATLNGTDPRTTFIYRTPAYPASLGMHAAAQARVPSRLGLSARSSLNMASILSIYSGSQRPPFACRETVLG